MALSDQAADPRLHPRIQVDLRMLMASLVRHGLDRLLDRFPECDLVLLDTQPGERLMAVVVDEHGRATGERSEHVGEPGPWVLIDLSDGGRYAIWKHTGAVYRVGKDGAVEDDPFLPAT